MLLQVNVKAKSAFNNKLFALNVVISIPVPDNTAKADIQTTQGIPIVPCGCTYFLFLIEYLTLVLCCDWLWCCELRLCDGCCGML